MADNVQLNVGAGGDVIAADDIGGVKHQRVKIEFGADGAATDVSSSNPLPIGGAAAHDAAAAGNPVPAGIVFDDTLPDAIDEGDVGYVRGSSRREMYIQIRDAAGGERGLNVDASGRIAVTVDAVVPGTSASSLGKAVDSAAGATDTVVAAGAVRDDALTTLTEADGDYSRLRVDSTGALWAQVTNAYQSTVDDAAVTPGTTQVLMVGAMADESSPDSVNEGDGGMLRMTLDRMLLVTDRPSAAGGNSNYTALSTAAVLTAQIKGSAGNVYSLEAYNANASARYVRLYNQTGAPASTDTANVVWQGMIPGNSGFVISWPKGRFFSTGIGIRATTAAAHNSTGALSADENLFNVSYT